MRAFRKKRAGEVCAGSLVLIALVSYIAAKMAGLDLTPLMAGN